MEALVVGIKKLDFTANDGPVRRTQFYLNFPSDNVEGQDVGSLSWDEMRNGPPPNIGVGELIQVEYNKSGKLRLVPARTAK